MVWYNICVMYISSLLLYSIVPNQSFALALHFKILKNKTQTSSGFFILGNYKIAKSFKHKSNLVAINKNLSFVLFRSPTHSWFYVTTPVTNVIIAHCLFHLNFIIFKNGYNKKEPLPTLKQSFHYKTNPKLSYIMCYYTALPQKFQTL